jgi:hypothetical protein
MSSVVRDSVALHLKACRVLSSGHRVQGVVGGDGTNPQESAGCKDFETGSQDVVAGPIYNDIINDIITCWHGIVRPMCIIQHSCLWNIARENLMTSTTDLSDGLTVRHGIYLRLDDLHSLTVDICKKLKSSCSTKHRRPHPIRQTFWRCRFVKSTSPPCFCHSQLR